MRLEQDINWDKSKNQNRLYVVGNIGSKKSIRGALQAQNCQRPVLETSQLSQLGYSNREVKSRPWEADSLLLNLQPFTRQLCGLRQNVQFLQASVSVTLPFKVLVKSRQVNLCIECLAHSPQEVLAGAVIILIIRTKDTMNAMDPCSILASN